MIGFFNGEKYFCFRNLEHFWDEVLKEKYDNWRFFAHYGGKFDCHFLFEDIKYKIPEKEFEFYCSGSSVIAFTITRGQNTWRFCDSGRLLPDSLKKLTNEFDVEHKKLDFAPLDPIYNEHDCRGLYEVLTKFFDAHGNVRSETIAAHAMAVWRTHFMPRDLRLYTPHMDVEKLARSAYFGGRCEVYRWDRAEVSLYDINSMYPAAMLGPMPVSYDCRTLRLPDNDEKHIGFFCADVDYPEIEIPALPLLLDKLYFPVGKFSGYWTSMELRQAIEDGAAVKIRYGCIFHTENIFDDYVRTIYAQKLQAELDGNGAMRTISKLLLNSLYGKFGQNRLRKTYCLDNGKMWIEKGSLMYRVWPLPNCEGLAFYWNACNSAHILPHIAATITSRARLCILSYLRAASPNVWYTDTDSIFTSGVLPDSKELGEMGFKDKGLFQAYGMKEYRFKTEIALKGVPTTFTDAAGNKTTDYTLAEQYLKGEKITFQRMAGLLESVRTGESSLRYITRTRQKQPCREKRARVGLYNTRPWRYDELLEPFNPPGGRVARGESLLQAVESLGGIKRAAVMIHKAFDPRTGKYPLKLSSEWERVPAHVMHRLIAKSGGNAPEELPYQLTEIGFDVRDVDDLIERLASPHRRVEKALKFQAEREAEKLAADEFRYDPYFDVDVPF